MNNYNLKPITEWLMFGDKFKVTGSLHPQFTNTECLFEMLTQKFLVKEALNTKHCLGLELGKESNSLQVHFPTISGNVFNNA